MAKSYKEKFRDEDGVWRTIGGRRVFIRTGQSLSDAMVESGKFKTKKDIEHQKNKYRKEAEYTTGKDKEENWEIYDALDELSKKDTNKESYEQAIDRIDKIQNLDERKQAITDYVNKTGTSIDVINDALAEKEYDRHLSQEYDKRFGNKEQQLSDTFEVGDLKRKALETLPKDHIDSHEGDLYIKKTPQSTELLNRMKDKDSGLLSTFKDQQTGEEWYDVPFANMSDDYNSKKDFHFAGEELYSDDPNRFGDKLRKYNEKMNPTQKTGNDYLPKASKVMTSGTSNRKEVSDNIQAHILEYYDNPVDFMEQMDVFNNMPTRWHAGQEMAKQGFYDIYYDDQREFLESLNINPKGKSFSDDRVFQTYSSLIGRESERLYNRLEKLYDQYKKEHKGSNVSLDDFRKWFK